MTRGTQLREVIAERELRIAPDDRIAYLRFDRPRPDTAQGGDWSCAFELVGFGEDVVQEVFGVDPVQALQLCLQMAEVVLSEKARTLDFAWVGGQGHGMYPLDNPPDAA